MSTLLGDDSHLSQHDDLQNAEDSQSEIDTVEHFVHQKDRSTSRPTKHSARLDGEFDPEELIFLESLFPELTDFQFVGSGGFGTVFSASQVHMNRRVAVKLAYAQLALNKDFVQRFQQQSRVQAYVMHPNIVTIFDAGIRNGRPYLIMEYVPNGTLRKRLLLRTLSCREALSMLQQVCNAMDCAHRANLIHGDIKPENILIDQYGQVKVSDFGLARIVGELGARVHGFRNDYAGATASYKAPELCSRPWITDSRADLYSAIVIFYEAMMDELPRGAFEAPSSTIRMVRPLRKQVDTLVFRGLHVNPNRRFQTALELTNSILAIMEDSRITQRVSLKRRFNKEERAKVWLIAGFLLMSLQVAVVGFFYLRSSRKLDSQRAFTAQALLTAKQKEGALVAVETELKKNNDKQKQRMSLVDPNEVNAIIQFSDRGACWLNSDFAEKDLSRYERLMINQILSEMHEAYLRIELANTTQDVRSDETIVSTVRLNYDQLNELEGRLWTRIDAIVPVAKQKFLRDTLPLYVDCNTLVTEMPGKLDSKSIEFGRLITTDPGMNLDSLNKSHSRSARRLFPSKLRYPQLFGWSAEDLPIRITIRRNGMWFAWSIEQSDHKTLPSNGSRRQPTETFRIVDKGESPTIPSGLRRFWWDPATGTGKPLTEINEKLEPDVGNLGSPDSTNATGH